MPIGSRWIGLRNGASTPSRIVLAGDDTGGTLALVTALRVRDLIREGADLPAPAAVIAFYPMTDFEDDHRSHRLFRHGFYLEMDKVEWYTDQYLPDQDTRIHPWASPLHAPDLSDLPPVHLSLAGFDPLRDEGMAMAERLRNAGGSPDCQVDPGLTHGFVNATGYSKHAAAAVDRAVTFLRGILRD